MKKRGIAAVLTLAMLVGTLAGCGKGQEAAKTTAAARTAAAAETAAAEAAKTENGGTETAGGGQLFADPVDLTILYMVGENLGSENLVMKEIFERTNVNANLISAPNACYKEKLNSVLASGILPDIVYLKENQKEDWIAEGALIPLDDLIEEYGSNIKNALIESDYITLRNVEDSHIYGLPYILRIPAQYAMGIRRDWLEELNLEVPTTIDELEAVLTAFKENQDVLGVDNLIPMAGNKSDVGYFTAVFEMFGISTSGENAAWTLDKDGNYISIYEHPYYEACIETLARWYQNGLLDPEYLTRNQNDVHALFNSGIAGCGFIFSTRYSTYTNSIREVDPDGYVDYMLPIKGIDGEQRVIGRQGLGDRACITIAAKDKAVECIKFLDWFYSEEGDILLNYGIEGLTYEMVDGKPVITGEYNQGWDALREIGVVDTGLAYNRNLDAYYQCMLFGKSVDECDELELLTYKAYSENEPYIVKPLRAFSTETSRSKGTEIYASLAEKEAKVINGSITIEDFRAALAQAKANGLDDMTKEMQACWAAVNK